MEDKCLKCGAAMEESFIPDHGGVQYEQQQIWVEGRSEYSFWSGGSKTSGRAVHSVRTLRCAGCGFLEFYADDKTDLGGESYKIFT